MLNSFASASYNMHNHVESIHLDVRKLCIDVFSIFILFEETKKTPNEPHWWKSRLSKREQRCAICVLNKSSGGIDIECVRYSNYKRNMSNDINVTHVNGLTEFSCRIYLIVWFVFQLLMLLQLLCITAENLHSQDCLHVWVIRYVN